MGAGIDLRWVCGFVGWFIVDCLFKFVIVAVFGLRWVGCCALVLCGWGVMVWVFTVYDLLWWWFCDMVCAVTLGLGLL